VLFLSDAFALSCEAPLIKKSTLVLKMSASLLRISAGGWFQLTDQEWENLKSQNATSSWGGRRTAPFVFTEHGVLMLSSVLNSERAIDVNIKIMRVYTKIKEMLLTHKDLLLKMEEMEKKVSGQDDKILQIFNYLKQFVQDQKTPRKEVGYKK
jgi:hypothetical protein